MNPVNFREIINHDDYPVDDMDDPKHQLTIDQIRSELADDGCAVIKNFISDSGLQMLLAEVLARKDQAYYSPKKICNVYLCDGDASLPDDHPRNIFIPRTNGFVTADLLGEETVSRQLYYWNPLRRFLADCLGKKELFIYDDPISNMIVNLGKPGQQLIKYGDTILIYLLFLLLA